jgi:low temperature requirement protein LtrA
MYESETRPRWVVPMRPRSPDEPHRASSPLELLFDLVIVIAVAQAATGLHHGLAEGHSGEAVLRYVLMFFAVWWAWMSFTWFASAYDVDDIPYRLLVFVQITGALIVASGIDRVFASADLTVTVFGYVVMRIASTVQWLRAAKSDPAHRPAALRYGLGTAACQVGWVALLFLPIQFLEPAFAIGIIVELLIPVWAERTTPTPWHVNHIRERYSLFTLIVLGETILSTSVAIQSATQEGGMNMQLTSIVIGGLLIVYSIWWLYFYRHTYLQMSSLRSGFIWSYGHYLVFSAIAAIGAGLALAVDMASHHAEISPIAAGMALAIPSAIYVLSLWVLQERVLSNNRFDTLVHPVTAVLILLTPFSGQTVLLTGILLTVLVVIRLVRHLE